MKLRDIYHGSFSRVVVSKRRISNGFTLIEILIIVGLFALLIASSLIIGLDSVGRSTVHGERDLAVLMLTGARTRALANINEAPQGVYIDSSNITIFEGSSYAAGVNKRVTPRNAGISIAPNPAEVVFDQITADVASDISIVFSNGSQSAQVDINTEGGIEW